MRLGMERLHRLELQMDIHIDEQPPECSQRLRSPGAQSYTMAAPWFEMQTIVIQMHLIRQNIDLGKPEINSRTRIGLVSFKLRVASWTL